MTDQILKQISGFEVFEDVPKEQLKWLVERSEICVYQPGENVIEPGKSIDHLIVMLDGEITIRVQQGNQFQQLGRSKAGDVAGLLPYSRMGKAVGYGNVILEATALFLHKDHFKELVQTQFELAQRLVHVMIDRVRFFTAFQQQNEKLVALGKLSAGLAHELNNPASAMVRGASELKKHIEYTPERFKSVLKVQVTEEQVDAVNKLIFEKAGNGMINLSLMEKTEREDEIADWLDEHGLDDGFECAATFVEYGFTIDDFEFLKTQVPEGHLPPVIEWVNSVLTTEKMVTEIEDASRRISELVTSIKVHSHMDQAVDKQSVDLAKLINSTLTLLNHKIKAKSIQVEIDIDKDLPIFKGYVSELNQVWMNILDNAVDAVDQNGLIKIHAEADSKYVYVIFNDNGSGIPEDIQTKIFDPFL